MIRRNAISSLRYIEKLKSPTSFEDDTIFVVYGSMDPRLRTSASLFWQGTCFMGLFCQSPKASSIKRSQNYFLLLFLFAFSQGLKNNLGFPAIFIALLFLDLSRKHKFLAAEPDGIYIYFVVVVVCWKNAQNNLLKFLDCQLLFPCLCLSS